MKKANLLFGALALLALGACSEDKDNGPVQETKETAFIQVNILTSPDFGGRAGETFEDGTEDENAISNAVLVFYDSQKSVMSTVPVSDANEIKDGTNTESPNVAKVKTVEAEVSILNGAFPSYMMVFANPVDASDVNWGLAAITDKKRDDFKGANSKFTMNNSVYFSDNKICREVAVSQDNFYQGESDKDSATPVDVYLERLAAKVQVKSATSGQTDLGTQEGVVEEGKRLKFTVTGWGLNGIARECFLSKNYGSFTYDGINGLLTNSFNWNDQSRFRSYWAITPFYNLPSNNKTGTNFLYPYVSDQVSNSNTLIYASWNDMKKKAGEVEYTLENTLNSAFYSTDALNRNSALISAVVAGYYTLNDERVDFYIYGNKIYKTADYIRAMAKQGAVIVKSDGTPLSDDMTDDALSKLFEIYHPTTPIAGDKDKGVEENKVTIVVKNSTENFNNYKFKVGNSEPEAISAANLDKVNETLQANCGLATAYTQGYAYFNIPIRHLAADPSEGEAWRAGSFGVVRNHKYEISISGFAPISFETLGKGVLDPDDPIVPPTEPNDKFGIKANFKVLSWRIVPRTVTLGKK